MRREIARAHSLRVPPGSELLSSPDRFSEACQGNRLNDADSLYINVYLTLTRLRCLFQTQRE